MLMLGLLCVFLGFAFESQLNQIKIIGQYNVVCKCVTVASLFQQCDRPQESFSSDRCVCLTLLRNLLWEGS